ncbi:NADPH-dependent FMN reductase [Sphingomonas morindae]|uniref:NAD(P)H-dependent oxidoreductase n=1 Tax=Sphingomonas morindae TaxID=1541170 RepID=A0ABY4X4X9_9SPHN|nr:NADPH-dependent FMN reductase [Sphingomonas morindae]USI71944.1 NAD(P)H-dependent oxidoreductase [Sphingomonas morindae]
MANPYIVGIGGTTGSGSTTECALAAALAAAEADGARVRLFGGGDLVALPHYRPGAVAESPVAQAMIEAVRAADGLVIASPGYHGSISGLVKNAIDYLEETARDARVYLDGLPVGLIVTAYGWQATGSTLGTLRAIVHALRGWPTPMGAAIKARSGLFVEGACTDPAAAAQLDLVGRQVVEFARLRLRAPLVTSTGPQTDNLG